MTRSSIRPTLPEDVPALSDLMAEAGLLPNLLPADLQWKYWRERTDWAGPRSFVLARGKEILAHAGVMPGSYCWDDRRVATLHAIDWAARPSVVGAGVSLMKYLAQKSEALLAIGGSAQTLQLLPHLGYRMCGLVTCYVRPLHPMRLLTPSVHPAWKVPARVLRSALWARQAPKVDISGWKVTRVGSDELSRIASIPTVATNGTAVLERTAELFRYALCCPIAPMELFALEKEGRARGYFLLAVALRQARLVDCRVDSDDSADWRVLIECAVRQARRHPRAAELVAWAGDSMLFRGLREAGFHARAELPVQLLGPQDPRLVPAALSVQMLDNDSAYRHLGRNEFWA